MNHQQIISFVHTQRLYYGESLRYLSSLLGISKDTLNNFELGRGNLPSSTLLDIIHHYGFDMDIHHDYKFQPPEENPEHIIRPRIPEPKPDDHENTI